MGSNKGAGRRARWGGVVALGLITFFLAVLVTWPSQRIVVGVHPSVALPALAVLILVGIAFDIVGVAVAVADEAPFHAKSAKRVRGARQALRLIRNADRVATFCNDVVGDIVGTISGAAGAVIVFRIAELSPALAWRREALGVAGLALIAAVTVGGKAAGKAFAIRRANRIALQVGRLLHSIEDATGIRALAGGDRRGS